MINRLDTFKENSNEEKNKDKQDLLYFYIKAFFEAKMKQKK